MIVFTAKNKVTGDVYVGNAKESVEDQWAQIIVQAEEDREGEVLSMIREYGAHQIAVETWGYADSPSESREMVRDACDELGAKTIKTSRGSLPKKALASKANLSLADELKEIEVPVEEEVPVPEKLRQAGSTRDYDEMKAVMVAIEMKRKGNQKSSALVSSPKKAVKSKSSAVVEKLSSKQATSIYSKAVGPSAKQKLPDGRVSSSAKEKKIKEAIAKERMERESAKAAKAASEADEMAALMARLDAKTKEKEKARRRR